MERREDLRASIRGQRNTDASIHVPGLSIPWVDKPGNKNSANREQVDWFPTLCGLAGLRVREA